MTRGPLPARRMFDKVVCEGLLQSAVVFVLFPAPGGGSCAAGGGPEGAAGAHAGEAERDPSRRGREPHGPRAGEQQSQASAGHFLFYFIFSSKHMASPWKIASHTR